MSKKKQKGISIRVLIPMVAVVLLLGCAIGGTIAWLTAQTDLVVNTFTVGDIDIELWERSYDPEKNTITGSYITNLVKENEYKIVPGRDMPKCPFVNIKNGSEPCWVFVKVEENNFINGLSYNIDVKTPDPDEEGSFTGEWTPLEGYANVYYIEFTPDSYDKYFNEAGCVTRNPKIDILSDNKIHVSGDITKEGLDKINSTASLNFTAYAIQHDGFPTVEKAWKELNKTYNIVTTTPAE